MDGGDTSKHNLPAQRTSFVGREREMLEVKRELAMTRLLTLTGAGGTGKTRLAQEVAKDLVGAYPDGVWLVELARSREPELVAQVVAGTLGVRERPGRPLGATLAEELRAKNVLLVLDNCEHLIEAVARPYGRVVGRLPEAADPGHQQGAAARARGGGAAAAPASRARAHRSCAADRGRAGTLGGDATLSGQGA